MSLLKTAQDVEGFLKQTPQQVLESQFELLVEIDEKFLTQIGIFSRSAAAPSLEKSEVSTPHLEEEKAKVRCRLSYFHASCVKAVLRGTLENCADEEDFLGAFRRQLNCMATLRWVPGEEEKKALNVSLHLNQAYQEAGVHRPQEAPDPVSPEVVRAFYDPDSHKAPEGESFEYARMRLHMALLGTALLNLLEN